MSEKKRKTTYWAFKILSIVIACGLPIFAVCEHFPLWTESHGVVRSVGVGFIISLVVILVIFRKSVFSYIGSKLKLDHAPPVVIWLALLIASYILVYINDFVQDLTTVLWMGLVGCTIGTALTYVAEHFYGNDEVDGDGRA